MSLIPATSPQGPAAHDRKCYRCGDTRHTASDCRFKDSECLHCGKKGHIARVCRIKGKALQRPQTARCLRKPAKATHHIDEGDSAADPVYTLFHTTGRKSSPMLVDFQKKPIPICRKLGIKILATFLCDFIYDAPAADDADRQKQH